MASDFSRTVLGLALAGALTLGLAACSGEPEAPENPDVVDQGYQSGDGSVRLWAENERGDSVALAGTDFAGDPVDSANWLGDIVVVNTWYAACPPCRKEAPVLGALATDRASEGVHLIGINKTDDAGAAQAFERNYDVPYPSIADATGQVTAVLQGVVPVKATPTTVVIDREGRVAARVLGSVEESTINGIVDDVLAEDEASAPVGNDE